MSPDSALGQLAQRVARLEQKVDDLASRAIERFSDLAETVKQARLDAAEDYKVFGPMIEERAELRAEMRHLKAELSKIDGNVVAALNECRNGLDELEKRWEARDTRERERDEDRKLVERRDRWARWLGAGAVTLTFISLTVGWLILAL